MTHTEQQQTRRSMFRRGGSAIIVAAILAAAGLDLTISRSAAEDAHRVPPPSLDEPSDPNRTTETAIVAGGCFWGVQGVFQHVKGVTEAISGYAGGDKDTAQYETVSSGTTGHAESVRITFDPRRISYGRLLQIYFSVVQDPTELNYQGPDSGTQYRSTIFPTSPAQQQVAKAYIDQLDRTHAFSAAIVTTVEPGRSFYPAEDYHQNFLTLNPTYPYIAINDIPKVENLKRLFPDLYRSDPVLVTVPTQVN